MGSAEEIERVEKQGSTANESSITAMMTNAATSLTLGGGLSHIYAMIEGLQMANHLALLKVRTPGNVNAFNNFFTEIANFQFIDLEWLKKALLGYLPEMDAFSLNFLNAGYLSPFVIANLGPLFFIFVAQWIFLLIILLLDRFSDKCPKLKPVIRKARNNMIWGGQMRFFMEGYLAFCTHSLLNLRFLDWSN